MGQRRSISSRVARFGVRGLGAEACGDASESTLRAPRSVPDAKNGSVVVTWPQTLLLEDFPQPCDARALSPNGRAHWTTQRAARQEAASRVKVEATVIRLRPVAGPVRLTFRYVFPNQRTRDIDNLTTGVTKACIDALVRGQWLAADDSEHVTAVRAVAVVEKRQRRLEIVIEPVLAATEEGIGG